jgi:NADH dehydrogenase
MYLVVGATGPIGLGGEICRLLRAAGRDTRALVRPTSDAQRVETLRQAGVELVEGDLKDPHSLRAACRDVGTVITTASVMVSRQPGDTVDGVDGRGQIELIDAAKTCGVGSFIFTSFSGHIDRKFPFRDAKREVERHLKASGLLYTILRPTFYMEVWLAPISGFDYLSGRAVIYGAGRNKISWLSFHDVARFALMCIDHADARNATFELGGPQALTPLEVVRIFEELSGRSFETEFVSEETLDAQTSGENAWLRSVAGLRRCYADGDIVDMRELTQRYPIPQTSVRDYATRVLAAAAGT